jgi:hypothetical protein
MINIIKKDFEEMDPRLTTTYYAYVVNRSFSLPQADTNDNFINIIYYFILELSIASIITCVA